MSYPIYTLGLLFFLSSCTRSYEPIDINNKSIAPDSLESTIHSFFLSGTRRANSLELRFWEAVESNDYLAIDNWLQEFSSLSVSEGEERLELLAAFVCSHQLMRGEVAPFDSFRDVLMTAQTAVATALKLRECRKLFSRLQSSMPGYGNAAAVTGFFDALIPLVSEDEAELQLQLSLLVERSGIEGRVAASTILGMSHSKAHLRQGIDVLGDCFSETNPVCTDSREPSLAPYKLHGTALHVAELHVKLGEDERARDIVERAEELATSWRHSSELRELLASAETSRSQWETFPKAGFLTTPPIRLAQTKGCAMCHQGASEGFRERLKHAGRFPGAAAILP